MFFIDLTKTKGIRFRLTLVYSTIFGCFVVLFALIFTREFIHSGQKDFDSALLNYAIDLANDPQVGIKGFRTNLKLPESELKKQFPFIEESTFFVIRSLDGALISESKERVPIFEIPYFKGGRQEMYTHRFHEIRHNSETYRAVNLKIVNEEGQGRILQVATPSTLLDLQEHRIILFNIITIPLFILIASLVSFTIAGKALAPIKILMETTNNIAATNLSLRVTEIHTGDEIEELAKIFNSLLDRLQKSFEAQEQFVANASHQLNTPLAIIKGELDVLESKERDLGDHIKFQKSLREELERLIELVKKMLLISRVEAGQESLNYKSLRLDDLLLGVISRLNAKARDKKITIRFIIGDGTDESQEFSIMGEKQLLDSMLENLLDNALKYSLVDSVVTILLNSKEGHYEILIQDQGPGMKNEDYALIVGRRFRRGPQMLLPGTGLGLWIAHKIAELHDAQISYERLQPQGSLFTIRFGTYFSQ